MILFQTPELLKKMFIFFSLCFYCLVGVFGDEVKSVSVTEGESVTLHTDLTDVQGVYLLEWFFSSQKTPIAIINTRASSVTISDGMFRDRLQGDKQTGSLTITNIKTQHSGRYEMLIQGMQITKITFIVTVNEQNFTSLTFISCAIVGALMFVAAVLIFCACSKNKQTNQEVVEAAQSVGEDITYANPRFCKRPTHQPRAAVEDDVVYVGVRQ